MIFLIDLSFGIILGALINYFSLGFCGAIYSFINKKNTYVLRSFLISIAVAGIGIFIYKVLSNGMYDFVGVSGINVVFILGSFLFGIGMILSDGCILGMIRDLGKGNLYHIITFIFVVIGTVVANFNIASFWKNLRKSSLFVYFPEVFGNTIGFLVFIAITLGLYIILCRYDKYQNKDDNKEYYLPKKNLVAALLLGILLVLYQVVKGYSLGISGVFPYFGAWAAMLAGIDPTTWNYVVLDSVKENICNGPLHLDMFYMVVGVLLGSCIVSLLCKTYRIQIIKSKKEVIKLCTGGFLMGYGTCLAGSCSLGGFLSSAANLSLSGYIYLFFMIIGAKFVTALIKEK